MTASGRKNNTQRLRQLGMAMASSGLLLSTSSHALTIGTPQFDSYLAQPLQVRVPVRDFKSGTTASYYVIQALPASAYEALNLPQPDFPVQDLKLRWVENAQGESQILISSRRAVSEPVITVLLEVRGPGQRWVRQLDLLLDPPPAHATDIRPARAEAQASTRATTPEQNPSGKYTSTATPASTSALRPSQYGPVESGEVLSVIAQNVRMDRSIPLPQMA